MQSTEMPGRVHNGNKQEMFVRYIVDKADVWGIEQPAWEQLKSEDWHRRRTVDGATTVPAQRLSLLSFCLLHLPPDPINVQSFIGTVLACNI